MQVPDLVFEAEHESRSGCLPTPTDCPAADEAGFEAIAQGRHPVISTNSSGTCCSNETRVGRGRVTSRSQASKTANIETAPVIYRSRRYHWRLGWHVSSGRNRRKADYSNSGEENKMQATHDQPPI